MSNNDSPPPPEQSRLPGAGARTLLNFAFQPYVDTALRRVIGHEALLRGPAGEPARQMLAQVARDDRHAFDLDCRNDAVRAGARLGLDRGEQALNINLLPNALGDGGRTLLSTFAVAAAEGLPTSRLVLEVTEGECVSDPASLRDLFADFREFAFRTALDDLLAGWANLKLLAEFRPHFVKLDLALVERIDEDGRRQAVVRGLKQACDDLGCEIIAEGVEREPESHCLSDLGIFLQQGYLFARPALDSLVNDPHFPAPAGD
ncbi:MAG: EAL domain-containing protein [Pseudomonadota bacterium]|nr:EAL domain-containing protein [Pseudomonadota bacterium]